MEKRSRFILIVLSIMLVALLVSIGVVGFVYAPPKEGRVAVDVAQDYHEVGVTPTEIRIGSAAVHSGPAKELGIQYVTYGADIAVREFNDNGGVFGRKINFIIRDDGYEPVRAASTTEELITKDEVFILSSYVGTPTGVVVRPIVEKYKVPLVGMFTGAEPLRTPLSPQIFHIRPSYYQETEHIVKYFADNVHLKKIAVMYQNDAFGLAGLKGTQLALERRSLQLFGTTTYERNTFELDAAVNGIIASDPEAVVMIGTYSQLAQIVKRVRAVKPDIYFHTVSFVGPEAFAKELGDTTRRVYVTQVVPPPYYTDMFDGLARYEETLHSYYPERTPTFGGLEGYISMRVLLEGIVRAGKEPTREKFTTALESLNFRDAGIGAPIEFSTTSHQALNRVYLTALVDGTYVLVPVK